MSTKEEVPRLPAGRPFVRAGQRFASVFGRLRAIEYVGAAVILALVGANAIEGEIILNDRALIAEAASKPPVIVGLTTAHKLVPLFPDGDAQQHCDNLCIAGELETFMKNFRKITGESVASGQLEQHEAKALVSAFVLANSPADSHVVAYFGRFDPFILSARGVKLDVRNVHVTPETDQPGRFDASWTDVMTNLRTNQVVGEHQFSGTIDAHADPAFRTVKDAHRNPGGVVVTDIRQFGDQ
jgi:type IV secretory pathway TrbF-like protein